MKVNKEDLIRFASANGISPREQDVIKCMLERKISIKDIAKELSLSPSTVNNHLNNIFTKTKTSSKAELMVCLIHGLSEKISNLEDFKRTPKVLVIDDEPDIGRLLEFELKNCGFEVYVESDPIKALDRVVTLDLDFIVSDIKMPNLSGYDLLHKVRSMHKYKPEIVFISGYSEYTQEYAYHLGAIAMFSKPVSCENIVNVLMENFIEETSNKKKYMGDEVVQDGFFEGDLVLDSNNVGTGGMFLKIDDAVLLSGEEFEVGKRHNIRVKVPGIEKSVSVVVEVKWRRLKSDTGSHAGLGLKFIDMDEEVRETIYQFTRQKEILSYIPIGKMAV